MRNWAGNQSYRASAVREPTSVEEIQELVRGSTRIRALGSRHSFNDIADTTGDHVSLAALPRRLEIDGSAARVTIDGGVRYGDLCEPLDEGGSALHNMASLPHISVAGSCATGTHGSGERSGSLATAVIALELVRGDGELVTIDNSEPERLAAAIVSLGALGIVTALTLEVEPSYQVRQDVYDRLPLAEVLSRFGEIGAAADSVSLFLDWRGPVVDQLWLKHRLDGQPFDPPPTLFGGLRATGERHPIRALSSDACTAQLGRPGAWYERLPHFRLDHTPSAGDELQSEYLVAREDAVDALVALDPLRDRIAPLIHVSEIRWIAADELWLSPAHRRDSVAIHFTWQSDWPAVRDVLPAVEAALAPFRPRPHWGKLFTLSPTDVQEGYPRLTDFRALAERMDPAGKFRNAFLDRLVFGAG
jgi:alditol oxidase